MSKFVQTMCHMRLEEFNLKSIVTIILGAFLFAVGMNYFMIPADVYSSGVTGIAQLLARIVGDYAPFLTTGIFLMLLNLPLAIISWFKLGKKFTLYSFSSVGFMTLFLEVIPVKSISDDMLLNAVFGGVITAVGIGITLRIGASTGGTDVIAILMSKSKGKSVGTYSFLLNGVVVVATGVLLGFDRALYTLVTLYVSMRMIDAIYTAQNKLTAMIVTTKGKELTSRIHEKLIRGVTQINVKGTFSNVDKDMLLIVISRFELVLLQETIQEVDKDAFTNIVQTVDVFGFFRRE